jgi:polar amino acid transport system substrate-binding protein
LAGKVDMLSVGLVNTPERALAIEFTDGYVPYRQVMVVPKNSTAKSINDLNKSGIKITALMGSTAENLAKTKLPKAQIVGLDQQEAMMEVTSGRADGVVVEEYLAMPLVANFPNKVKILNPDAPFKDEMGAWAVRPGDYRFLRYLNNWLRYYKTSGTLDAMFEKIIKPSWYK